MWLRGHRRREKALSRKGRKGNRGGRREHRGFGLGGKFLDTVRKSPWKKPCRGKRRRGRTGEGAGGVRGLGCGPILLGRACRRVITEHVSKQGSAARFELIHRIFLETREIGANKRRKNHFSKRKILWSPRQLATRFRALSKPDCRPHPTLKFLVDNKRFRRRMWEKVAVSGRIDRGRGQK